MALTNEDLLAISKLFDPFKNELMEVKLNMVTKDDLANVAMKSDIANMATKDDLLQLENDILEELDIVQEHSNKNYYRLESQISQMRSDINTIIV